MSTRVLLCLVLFASVLCVSAEQEDVCNLCIDGKYHKSEPGPEDNLYSKCSPWKSRSCCTNQTAYWAHQGGPGALYDFTYNHCPNNPMSAKCRDRFQENSCFYECSPNIGPWMVKEPNSHRSERFRDVPLSPAVCNAWFNDCKDDYTCKDNWAVGWDWSSGTNVCPADKPCKKFSEIFTSATEMCETIYPDDFKVTTNGPTMVLWFLGDTNPNDAVAAYYATEMNLRCGAGKLIDNIVLTTLMAIISLAFFQY